MKPEIKTTKDVNRVTNVKFVDHYMPALDAGEYTITLEQNTGGSGAGGSVADQFTSTKNFIIKGDRFSLNPNNVHSVFPFDNIQGDYGNSIPHIVLTNKVLPWARGLGAGKEKYPWLALLTFKADEAPEIKEVELANFKTDKLPVLASGVLFYDFTKEADEKDSDKCNIVDIKVDLFNQIVPNIEDINYLSHVREVEVSKKSANFLNPSKFLELHPESLSPVQIFSVIVGNRLLATDKPTQKYVVHLVSLENMGQYLPNKDDKPGIIDNTIKYVRLVTLYNWKFTATKNTKNLSDVVAALNNSYVGGSEITLRLPAVAQDSSKASDLLNEAYSKGYCAARYNMRGGDNNLAWYRGPFIPYPPSTSDIINWPNSHPDALLRYNPNTSMFDVSYAAAWQIGCLLAIQNKHFAETLYKWKKMNKQASIKVVEKEILQEELQLPDLSQGLINDVEIKRAIMAKIQTTLERYLKV